MSRERIIGVREFRARLSAYLRAVAGGAVVTVGDRRRRPLVRVVPAGAERDHEILERLAREGIVSRGAGGKPGKAARRPATRRRRLVSDIVIEDRR